MSDDDELTEDQEPVVLAGEDAVALWRQGKDAWNAWIDEHPGARIDFSGVDFSGEERNKFGRISFANYRFGDGVVSFFSATFGDGGVSFDGAIFRDGGVSFARAIFGDGGVSFTSTTFGDGDVSFDGATFGDGGVSFVIATFGDGDVSFHGAIFGDGGVSFTGGTFGDGGVSFDHANFGDGGVLFSGATFGDGAVSFRGARVEDLGFWPRAPGTRRMDFSGLKVRGRMILSIPRDSPALASISLRNAAFDGPLTFAGDVACVPDLRGTKTAHHVDLSGLHVTLRRVSPLPAWLRWLFRKAEDPDDAPRLRRLKEIAEANKDHRAALRFSADENRALRWHRTPWPASVLDMAFSFFSDYGQSIWRPSAALVALAGVFAGLYRALACVPSVLIPGGAWPHAARLSLANNLPFMPQSRELRIEATKALYAAPHSLWIDAAMVAQGLAAFALLFLIGLGLRNRFRL